MNKIFKVIYSKVRNCYVVTSEFAKANTKSSTGSAKQTAKKSLLSLAIAMGIACGGFVNVGAAEFVEVQTIGGSKEKVYTKFGTEVYVRDEVEHKIKKELKYYYTTSQVDQKLEALSTGATTNKDNITTLDSKTAGLSADGKSLSGMTTVSGTNVETGALTVTGEIKNGAGVTTTLADINDSMKKTTRIDYDAANDTTSVNGMKVGQQVDMGGKNLTNVGTINGIALGEKESGDFISQDGSIWGNMKNVDAQVGKNLVAIGENTEAITNLDTKVGTVGTGTYLDPTKSIGENLGRLDVGLNQEVADRTAADNDLSDRIGTVTDDGNYIKKSATNNVSENLKVLDGELAKTNDRTGGITRNADDTKTTIEGKVTVDKDGNVGGVKDLTVDGKLNVGEIYLENNKLDSPSGKKHDSATAITADGISNLAKVTDHGHTTESQFTHNEKGTINYAKDGDTTDWTETRSDVTAKGVTTKVKDSKQNRTNTSQTADGIKGYATDKDGNKTYTKVTATENSFQIQDKDGKNKNHQVNTKDSSVTEITNEDGKTTKTEQTATDITNTAKDGTITNDAQTIVNNTTGDMTNTVGGKLTTTVTGQATENFNGGLDTNVTGTENHIVTGAQTIHVTENQTNTIDGNQKNTIGGDQTTTVTGNISNTAENITNEANTKLTDKVGDNTRVLDSEGITDTVPGADGKGSTFKQRIDAIMGNVKTDAGESEVIQTGDEITSVVGKGEATNSRMTQKKGSLEAAVTDGTNTNVSYDVANASAKVLTDGTKVNKLQDNLDSSEKTITNGTYTTSKLQTALDITNTAKDGTIKNDAKNIVNNASGDMTNTVGGKLTTTVTGQATETYNGGLDTNVTGTENHTVTGAQNIHVTGNQTNEVGGNQTTTVAGDISNSAKNIVNTADESITNNAKVINNKASEVINNEAVNINNKASGIISSSASEIKNQADKLISNKVGENTYQNIENGKITESIKDGIKQNLTQSDADKTEHSVVNGKNATVNKQTSEELTGAVTNGFSSNVIQNTAISSNNTIADWDAAGKPTKANSVISTVDGTTFSNTEANTVLTAKKDLGKDFTNTTIKGNTITTGQATMDYADVMKDLGVRGNANIQGKTTTGSLEVTGTSTLKGDVTMESNATVKKDLTVEGTTTTKDLHVTNNATVGGNATITGDVTANSYKVGNNTYIDANGINANNQKVTNVADGTIAEGSMDAVNGGQLFETNRRIEQFDSRINEVGANAAAMANLHPMEFDADSKLNVAVGVGNYRNKTATAMGLFYRPNEDVMFNVSSTIGSNDNMVGGGISFRLGSGGNKEKAKALAQATEHNKQLKSQVDMLQAQMDALLSVINPNMSKDFPDVPDNHWAYEAVSRLAGNDIIQGYEDGKYHGERTMTRYEMAVIIYKALQKGTKAEAKLVEEFKPELKAIAAHEKA